MMIFEKVNPADPLGALIVVMTLPTPLGTAHGERAAQRPWKHRHVPKYGHSRKTLMSIGVRSEGRRNENRFSAEPFEPLPSQLTGKREVNRAIHLVKKPEPLPVNGINRTIREVFNETVRTLVRIKRH